MFIYSLVVLVLCSSVVSAAALKRADDDASVHFTGAKLTQKWIEGSHLVQIVEATLNNTGTTDSKWIRTADHLVVSVEESDFLVTEKPATVIRLQPGDSVTVQVGVKLKEGVSAGASCSATLVATWATSSEKLNFHGICGILDYDASTTSLAQHETPDWFNDAKFGIFMHWGLYSVPAYGGLDPELYAEWYWQHLNDPNDSTNTREYHAEKYGKEFEYDQFIDGFTAEKFDPKAWVQLVADAGARYFVPTTKHHDGWALFNSPPNVTRRNTVNYGPKRDFIKELFDAAKSSQPQLRRGTYYSLPEWYNPLYKPLGDGNWPGEPKNAYTGEPIPYTGLVDNIDYLEGFQTPQIMSLMYEYETDILWCDIGGDNNSTILNSAWLNWTKDRGRQVTFNNRCGISGDYSTPEYSTNDWISLRHFETCRGMDPFSFGYNAVTPDEDYMSGEDVVRMIVDVSSKNGNLLLNVGPKADGTIADVMQNNLRTAGAWLKSHGESIYGTRYWARTPGLNNLRYTTLPTAFFVHTFDAPNGDLIIPDPVPYAEGDKVTILGGSLDGHPVQLIKNEDGTYIIKGNAETAAADQHVWTFKIEYQS